MCQKQKRDKEEDAKKVQIEGSSSSLTLDEDYSTTDQEYDVIHNNTYHGRNHQTGDYMQCNG